MKTAIGDTDTEVFAGQLVAQGMMLQILMGHIALIAPTHGASIRDTLGQCVATMQANRNMSPGEKFGAVKTLEDAIDTLEKLQAGELLAHRE